MKSNKFNKKLNLNKETIANIGKKEMNSIRGMEDDMGSYTSCPAANCDCFIVASALPPLACIDPTRD